MFGEPGLGIFFAFSLMGPVMLLGLVALAVVSVSGAREPDPTGARQRSVYLAATSFVALFVMVGAAFAATASLTGLIDSDEGFIESRSARVVTGRSGEEIELRQFEEDEDDEELVDEGGSSTEEAVSGAVAAALVLVSAGVVFLFHRQRMEELVQAPGFLTSPVRRPVQGYHYAVCFVASLVLLVAAAVGLYAIFRIALPDVASPDVDDGARAARDLISMAVLAGVSGLVFVTHWGRPEAWMRTGVAGPGPQPPVPPPPPPPPPPGTPAPPPFARPTPPPPPEPPLPEQAPAGAAPVPRWETPGPAPEPTPAPEPDAEGAPPEPVKKAARKAAKAAPKKAAAPTRKRAAKRVAPDPDAGAAPEGAAAEGAAEPAPDAGPGAGPGSSPAAPEGASGDREPPEAPVP